MNVRARLAWSSLSPGSRGAGHVVKLRAGAGGGHPAVQIGRIERSEPDPRLRRTALVAPALPVTDDLRQIGTRVGEEAEATGDLGRLQQRVLVLRPQLEDF